MRRRLRRLATSSCFCCFALRSIDSPAVSLVLLTYRGRRVTVPVMYAEDDRELTVFVGHPEWKNWWRNLGDGATVDVWLRRRRLRGRAAVTRDAAAADGYLKRHPRARTAVGAESQPTFVGISHSSRLPELCGQVRRQDRHRHGSARACVDGSSEHTPN